MKLASLRLAIFLATLPAVGLAQEAASGQAQLGSTVSTKIAVIDIDRVAAESESGKALLARLKEESDRIAEERARREREIRDLQAKMTSEVLSVEARERLSREIERKRTEAQRWLEDAQREFQEKQADGEEEFQRKLAPIVERVARDNGIGLILRATPGLTFVLDPTLDISPLVVQRLNEAETAAAPTSGGTSDRPTTDDANPPPN